MKIIAFADVHLGLLILDSKLFYETIWLPIMNRLRYMGTEIDLVVFCGDLFHKSFPKDSDVVTVARKMLSELISLSNETNNFPIRLIRGTRSHDSNMFEYIKDLTKYGNVYNIDTSFLENKILQNIKNSKEYIVSHIHESDNTLTEDVNSLLNLLKCSMGDEGNNFLIYETPKIEMIKGRRVLFCPEIYDTDDEYIRSLFISRPDMCFYHGMIEGALDHYHETTTSLIYNRSITLKRELLNCVKLFTVAGHIHTRMAMIPHVPAENMVSVSRNLRAWYVGCLHQQTFFDSGMKKGFDIITVNRDDTFEAEFIETKNSPQFYVYRMTKEFQHFEVNEIIQVFLKRMNKNQGHTRIDIDIGVLNDKEKIKVEQFKAKFPNCNYKVINSKLEQQKEEKANAEYQKLIQKPIKELILDICEGDISPEDYDRYFSDM